MKCSCCGEDRAIVVGLQCHSDVKICQVCIGWLREQLGVLDVTPILPVRDMEESAAFYQAAGFDVDVYGDAVEYGHHAFVRFDEESVFDLGLEESSSGSSCYIIVPDPDRWHSDLEKLGCQVSDVINESWGMREFALIDPNGNRLRFGHSSC